MAMSKKDFIALAEAVRGHNDPDNIVVRNYNGKAFTKDQIEVLADFCAERSPRFMRDRWLGYVAGKNGKNGGEVRK